MKHPLWRATLLGAALAVGHTAVLAQSVTVLGSGSDARNCSTNAQMSSTLYAARGDLDPCNRALDEVQLRGYDRAGTLVNRGILLAALGRYQDALNDYNSALRIEAELPQAYVGKGNLYYLAERFDEAIDSYNRALELNLQERHVAYYNLGLTYDKLGDAAAAERNWRSALEAAPGWELPQDKLDQRRAAQP